MANRCRTKLSSFLLEIILIICLSIKSSPVITKNPKMDYFHISNEVQNYKLTLSVELADNSVQVGVLETNMTSSHRHFVAE